MILWLLRLFVDFRELESDAAESAEAARELKQELQRENAAKIQLQDRVRDLEADNLQLRTALQDAQAKTIHSVEMVTDFLSQQMFGRNVFGRAPELPEGDQSPEIIPRPGRQAREVVEEETRAFYQDLAAKREN